MSGEDKILFKDIAFQFYIMTKPVTPTVLPHAFLLLSFLSLSPDMLCVFDSLEH